jgi:hypothetical protein
MTTSTPFKSDAPPEVDGSSYDLPRLLRISSHANILSWIFAIVGWVGVAWGLYTLYNAYIPWGRGDSIPEMVIAVLIVSFLILQCFFFSLLSRAVAEGLFAIRDIEDNTRTRAWS